MANEHLTNSDEIWKPIPGYSGYEVSNQGRVRSFWRRTQGTSVLDNHPQRILKPGRTDGYPYVGLKNGTFPVHRLVLLAFVGPCPSGYECCHADGTRTNNYLENLRWGTKNDNCADQTKHGTKCMGEQHGQAKLTTIQVLQIRSLYAQGTYTTRGLGELYGINHATIWGIISGRQWRHLL